MSPSIRRLSGGPGQSAVKCNQLSKADPKLADLMIFQLPLKRGITSLLSILDGCYSIQSVSYKLSDKKIPQHNLLLLHIFLHKCTWHSLNDKRTRYLKAGNREIKISSDWFRKRILRCPLSCTVTCHMLLIK